MFYAIVALGIRLLLAIQLWKRGKFALSAQTRTIGNAIELVNAASLFLGFFVYPFTLVLLFHVGIRMWTNWKSGSSLGKDPLLLILILIIFLKGPGGISLDKLVGNI